MDGLEIGECRHDCVFGVMEENNTGRRVIDFCSERGHNSLSEQKSISGVFLELFLEVNTCLTFL